MTTGHHARSGYWPADGVKMTTVGIPVLVALSSLVVIPVLVTGVKMTTGRNAVLVTDLLMG